MSHDPPKLKSNQLPLTSSQVSIPPPSPGSKTPLILKVTNSLRASLTKHSLTYQIYISISFGNFSVLLSKISRNWPPFSNSSTYSKERKTGKGRVEIGETREEKTMETRNRDVVTIIFTKQRTEYSQENSGIITNKEDVKVLKANQESHGCYLQINFFFICIWINDTSLPR